MPSSSAYRNKWMLTIELTEEEPGNEDEACLRDEAEPEDGGGGEVACSRRKMKVQRNLSTERFQGAVNRVKLGIRVVKRMQFHTTRTVARAIEGPGDHAPKGRAQEMAPGALGHFPVVLRMICKLVRPTEQCYLVVELVSPDPANLLQYLVMIRATNEDKVKEDMMLGAEVDIVDNKPTNLRFAISIPIKSNVTVRLDDGDGSLMICARQLGVILKPANIQSQWAAINFLNSSLENALEHTMFEHGKSHGWCCYYQNQITNQHQLAPHNWRTTNIRATQRKSILEIFDNRGKQTVSRTKSVPQIRPTSEIDKYNHLTSLDEMSQLIIKTLKSVMYAMDLDDASTKSIRMALEDKMGINLDHHKNFIEEKMLLIYGQMDESSRINDYMFLGTEWNACNFEEMINNGITHVLNVTDDCESPFESTFKYLRIEVKDIPEVNIMKHWETTNEFINNCRNENGKVLVHCQRGISRSGSTVVAHIMRSQNLPFEEALDFVQDQRSCVQPNPGFEKQLEFYQDSLRQYGNDPKTLKMIMSSTELGDVYSRDEV